MKSAHNGYKSPVQKLKKKCKLRKIKHACLALYIVTASFGNPLIDAKGWRIPFI
jgi:hypothetical protein